MTFSGRPRSTPMRSSTQLQFAEKYTPKREVVTVAVGPPPSRTGSSAHAPQRLRLHHSGDRRAHEARRRAPSGLADKDLRGAAASRTDKRLLGECIARDLIQRLKELESKLKTAKETGERILERAELSQKDWMYEFGTWAFTSGRRAMQNDFRAALEASVDEDDLPKLLVVLPKDVPDPGPTPFSKVARLSLDQWLRPSRSQARSRLKRASSPRYCNREPGLVESGITLF
nr:histone-lysine N-methyltransferase SETD1A-like [Ipomoea batatas]